MASNSFGTLFRITTWGESHGKAIGVVIDGCPAGLPLTEEEVNTELALRAPGKSPHTSPRKEPDQAEILSGLFKGKTTGAPISIIIPNKDADPSKYTPIKELMRPGHANFTYLKKYGIFDYRGGGRASARETACRVAAGAVAKKLLAHFGVTVTAQIHSIGGATTEKEILKVLENLNGDSVGGVVSCTVTGLPIGLGDPIYEKLEANLAKGMLSIPASKGFEIGSGFEAARIKGSEHNDSFTTDESGNIVPTSNHAGGTLGGISTGLPLDFRVAFKPTSSIARAQPTVDTAGGAQIFELPAGSRHDPCVAIRAVPVVAAMAALNCVDCYLMNYCSKMHCYSS
ncbi:chorismate synthase [Candidatus Neptunochlamydia vexilliferae]|nr:chorismate synthase [Candidatus Neptunochlamydia vexilliferae]